MAVRIDDTASSPAYDVVQSFYFIPAADIVRVHISCKIHVAIYEVTVSFYGYMPYGGLPLLVIIGVRRYVNGDSLLIQGYSCLLYTSIELMAHIQSTD